jgi:TolA-binding protein
MKEMTPPVGTLVAYRGWVRGGGVIFFAANLLLTSGCAMKGDVRRLQEEVALQSSRQDAQLGELRALAADIQENIEALQDTLDVQSGMVVDSRGGISRELREIQTQLSQLTALTGQIQRSMVSISARVQAEGARVTTSDRRADPDSLRALMGRDGGNRAAPEETYEAAMTQYGRGSLNTAQMALRSFLGDFPDHQLAPRAQFFLADILEQESRLDEAVAEFLRVSELYPSTDQVPNALYRIALIYVEQEKDDEAVIFLERLTSTYPDSGPAELAQQLLQEIR